MLSGEPTHTTDFDGSDDAVGTLGPVTFKVVQDGVEISGFEGLGSGQSPLEVHTLSSIRDIDLVILLYPILDLCQLDSLSQQVSYEVLGV